ncbi:MAG: 6-phosphofructokinase [Rhabdochlamydiaceae bacterium]|nr:6-phosphofructokinase [Rhabdochlamydiaceae bacterium]
MLTLSDQRRRYKPKIPGLLQDPRSVAFETIKTLPVDPEIESHFPLTKTISALKGCKGPHAASPAKIGVVFSGGPAPGGHNVIAGIFDTLGAGSLIGFLGGPGAIVSGSYKELKSAEIDHYRNQGGFDLLGSGRAKIETPEQFQDVLNVVKKLKLDGLIIVGGDDSNTNTALLAEYFLKEKAPTCVIGVPKTIDGDIQNPYVPISFGFDTAAKIYSEMIGNLAQDTVSSLKYFHFVKLMGRSASHLTLECALKTHPNITLISEEKKPFQTQIKELADWVESRAKTPYGVILVPEGLLEATLDSAAVQKDSHGNINLSSISTELFLIEALQKQLQARSFKGKFEPLSHFYGYEGRCGHPSNFDANYSYALGITAALLVLHRHTGLMAYVGKLERPPAEWTFGGAPLAPLLKMQKRNGVLKPVIDKALVDLNGKPYQTLQKNRAAWMNHSAYENPGPLQFEGDPQITDSIPLILQC